MPIPERDIQQYITVKAQGLGKHPELARHMWLVHTKSGAVAIGHDAVYMGEMLGMPVDKQRNPDTKGMTDLLVIPKEWLVKAYETIGTYHEPVVVCALDDTNSVETVTIAVVNPQFTNLS